MLVFFTLPVLHEHRVPQGSILGPLLFIMYTPDIPCIVSNHGLLCVCYAHDTQLYFHLKKRKIPVDNAMVRNVFNKYIQTEVIWCSSAHPKGTFEQPLHRTVSNPVILCSVWPWSTMTCRHVHQRSDKRYVRHWHHLPGGCSIRTCAVAHRLLQYIVHNCSSLSSTTTAVADHHSTYHVRSVKIWPYNWFHMWRWSLVTDYSAGTFENLYSCFLRPSMDLHLTTSLTLLFDLQLWLGVETLDHQQRFNLFNLHIQNNLLNEILLSQGRRCGTLYHQCSWCYNVICLSSSFKSAFV